MVRNGLLMDIKVETEPHHHHYDPDDRRKRRENYHVSTLESAIEFINEFLESGKEFKASP